MTQTPGYKMVKGCLVLSNGERIPGILYYNDGQFKGFKPNEHNIKHGLFAFQIHEPNEPKFRGLNAIFSNGWKVEPDTPIELLESVD